MRDFYHHDPAIVAPMLLGKFLVRTLDSGSVLMGMINEVEAYLPYDDPASHGFKPRKHTESLFKEGGHAYVHTMRHHVLLDVVTEGKNRPGSVLIRGVVPIKGEAHMMELRGKTEQRGLTNGPGKVCQAFAITRGHDGVDLTTNRSVLYISEGQHELREPVKTSERIGITKAKDALLRFYF